MPVAAPEGIPSRCSVTGNRLLSLACPRESNQRERPPGVLVPAGFPPQTQKIPKASLTHRPEKTGSVASALTPLFSEVEKPQVVLVCSYTELESPHEKCILYSRSIEWNYWCNVSGRESAIYILSSRSQSSLILFFRKGHLTECYTMAMFFELFGHPHNTLTGGCYTAFRITYCYVQEKIDER